MISPVLSMKGWDWKLWLKAHYLDIKKAIESPQFDTIFKPIMKYLVSFLVANFMVDGIVAEGILTIAGKSILDIADYYFSNM